MAPINYQKLQPSRHEIRILTLLPPDSSAHGKLAKPLDSLVGTPSFGSTLESSPVSCILSTVSLDDKGHRFIALSYTWGPPSPTKQILVNGKNVQVRSNLEDALRHIRQPSCPVTLWVDAICINQDNKIEKNEQVPLMGKIYKAATVLAWLGPATDDSDIAMMEIESIGAQAVKTGIMTLSGPDLLTWRNSDASTRLVTIKHAVDELGEAVFPEFPHFAWKKLSERAYWTRLWIMQEMSLPRDILFICGSKSTQFTHLAASTIMLAMARTNKARTVNVLELVDPVLGPPLEEFFNSTPSGAPSVLIGCRRKCQAETGTREILLALLRRSCVAKPHPPNTAELRDIVYGLLGMASDLESLKGLGFEVDYEKTIQEVYSLTTKCLINQGHTIVLAWAQHQRRLPDLPSFVPDFSTQIREPCGETNNYPLFNASGGYSYRIPENLINSTNDSSTLLITCVRVDTIQERGPPLIPKEDDSHLFVVREFLSSIESFCMRARTQSLNPQASNTRPRSSSPREGAQYRIPCADQHLSQYRIRASSAIKQGYEELRTYLDGLPDTATHVRTPACNNYLRSIQYQYHQAAFLSLEGYVGLAPAQARTGDVICIVLGSTIPFVFREQADGCHILIGEAYVDSLMDGEFMLGSPKMETFCVV